MAFQFAGKFHLHPPAVAGFLLLWPQKKKERKKKKEKKDL
jgi:hypothetical protein